VPGEIIEHQAHAVGHAAVLLADRGVLLAGDMLSDVLIPLFDSRQTIRWAPTRRHSTGW
jgi:glyoxylase-like metal-dependent hydrolase (beta-lactamase superfamily II)